MKCAFIADTGTGDMNQKLVGKGLSELVKNKGNTDVKIKFNNGKEELVFKLKNKRFVDRKLLNIIKNQDILTTIQ